MAGLERAVVLVNGLTIRGRMRLQLHGFLASQMYRSDLRHLGFYRDWTPHHCGPHSGDLDADIRRCVDDGMLSEAAESACSGQVCHKFEVTPRGKSLLRSAPNVSESAIRRLHERFAALNETPWPTLLERTKRSYPEYAAGGPASSSLLDSVADYDVEEGTNPEIERAIDDIASGKFVGKEYTAELIQRMLKA